MTLPAGYTRSIATGIYKDDGTGPYMENADGSLSQGLPKKFFTDNDGANARLRVDVAQTGFFAGREFRTFLRLNLATSATQVIKVVVPLNTILFKLAAEITSGNLDVSTRVGGVEGGAFGTPLPIFRTNNMSTIPQPPYVGQLTLATGGTLTGGTEISVLLAKAADVSAQSSTVGSDPQDERGVAAGTYYFVLTNLSASDAVIGVFEARWEERP